MGFEAVRLRRELMVERLYTVHYYEYSSSYYFVGERHDFWEFLYVDKGEVDVQAGEAVKRLTRGQVIFHEPGEFHGLRATGEKAPNLVVVSFACAGEAMEALKGRTLTVGEAERALLARIVEEGQAVFETPLDDPLTTALVRRGEVPFGAEQYLLLALEELLLRLVCRARAPEAGSEKRENHLGLQGRDAVFDRVWGYLESNLSVPLTLTQVCRDNLVGRSRLQQVFREKTGGGIMEAFGRLKIDAAHRMIREGGRNFTEISAALGYQSIYYFSRHFKKVTGMTPSEYAASVKMLTAKNRPS